MTDIKQPELPQSVGEVVRQQWCETVLRAWHEPAYTADQMHAHYAKGQKDGGPWYKELEKRLIQFVGIGWDDENPEYCFDQLLAAHKDQVLKQSLAQSAYPACTITVPESEGKMEICWHETLPAGKHDLYRIPPSTVVRESRTTDLIPDADARNIRGTDLIAQPAQAAVPKGYEIKKIGDTTYSIKRKWGKNSRTFVADMNSREDGQNMLSHLCASLINAAPEREGGV